MAGKINYIWVKPPPRDESYKFEKSVSLLGGNTRPLTRFERHESLNFGSEDSSLILLIEELFGIQSGLHQEGVSSVILVSYPSGRALGSPEKYLFTASGS